MPLHQTLFDSWRFLHVPSLICFQHHIQKRQPKRWNQYRGKGPKKRPRNSLSSRGIAVTTERHEMGREKGVRTTHRSRTRVRLRTFSSHDSSIDPATDARARERTGDGDIPRKQSENERESVVHAPTYPLVACMLLSSRRSRIR